MDLLSFEEVVALVEARDHEIQLAAFKKAELFLASKGYNAAANWMRNLAEKHTS